MFSPRAVRRTLLELGVEQTLADKLILVEGEEGQKGQKGEGTKGKGTGGARRAGARRARASGEAPLYMLVPRRPAHAWHARARTVAVKLLVPRRREKTTCIRKHSPQSPSCWCLDAQRQT